MVRQQRNGVGRFWMFEEFRWAVQPRNGRSEIFPSLSHFCYGNKLIGLLRKMRRTRNRRQHPFFSPAVHQRIEQFFQRLLSLAFGILPHGRLIVPDALNPRHDQDNFIDPVPKVHPFYFCA